MMCDKGNAVLAGKSLSLAQDIIVQVQHMESYSGCHSSSSAELFHRSDELARNATRNTYNVQGCLALRMLPKKLAQLIASHEKATAKGFNRSHPQNPLI
jgi:hypothetical protein